MAWTAPATWSVSEIVTASKMNLHIRDNLNYLKGNAGAVTIADSVLVQKASGAASLGIQISAATSYGQFIFNDQTGAQASYLGFIGASAGLGARDNTVEMGTVNKDLTFRAGTTGATEYMRMLNANGNFGVGTAAPQGKIHALGVGGGCMFLSANAVDGTLQTIAVAGTVANGGSVLILDRNNTGGGLYTGLLAATALGAAVAYVNTDTITISFTAGGAITVQRTAGTNGTHNMNMLVLYK